MSVCYSKKPRVSHVGEVYGIFKIIEHRPHGGFVTASCRACGAIWEGPLCSIKSGRKHQCSACGKEGNGYYESTVTDSNEEK